MCGFLCSSDPHATHSNIIVAVLYTLSWHGRCILSVGMSPVNYRVRSCFSYVQNEAVAVMGVVKASDPHGDTTNNNKCCVPGGG